jgi:hypothetical protein
MKTNQIMIRTKEAFFQRTSDGYFNAAKLLSFWNKNNPQQKQLARYKIIDSTKEFIKQLQKEGIEKPFIAGKGSGEKAGTWMHPKLFIDFAMWVSVEFKSIVIDYVLDGLIKSRHDAGDYYNEMSAAIMERYIEYHNTKPPALIFINEANLIKDIANLNIPRNEMTEAQLNKITILQKFNTQLIKEKIGKESRKKSLMQLSRSL